MIKNPPVNALLSAWQETLARRAADAAVLAPDGTVARRFGDVEAEGRAISELLCALPPRSVVAVQIGNSASWPALLVALFRADLIPLPLGRHMATAELQQALETCRTVALITAAGDALNVSPLSTSSSGPPPDADFLKLTSGTTAAPRAIRFRAEQLVADCEQICRTMGITDRDLNYGAIPFSHSYGFSNLLTPLLCRGVPLVATEDRLPRAIVEGLACTGASVFPGMPVFYQALAQITGAPALPQLRLCISAGAPLPREVAESFEKKFGRRIHVFYGSSECGGITYDGEGFSDSQDGFVGSGMDGVEITPMRSDEPTPITIRSAAVGEGYWPDEDQTVLGGGCFIPGDLVRLTPRGLVLAGRGSDMINIAGRKLNPLELEQRLLTCAGVRQAIVFGVPSRLRGEEPVACVSGDALESADVLRFCQRELSPWQMPRDIWVVPEITTNERGKISRRALAERYLNEKAS